MACMRLWARGRCGERVHMAVWMHGRSARRCTWRGASCPLGPRGNSVTGGFVINDCSCRAHCNLPQPVFLNHDDGAHARWRLQWKHSLSC